MATHTLRQQAGLDLLEAGTSGLTLEIAGAGDAAPIQASPTAELHVFGYIRIGPLLATSYVLIGGDQWGVVLTMTGQLVFATATGSATSTETFAEGDYVRFAVSWSSSGGPVAMYVGGDGSDPLTMTVAGTLASIPASTGAIQINLPNGWAIGKLAVSMDQSSGYGGSEVLSPVLLGHGVVYDLDITDPTNDLMGNHTPTVVSGSSSIVRLADAYRRSDWRGGVVNAWRLGPVLSRLQAGGSALVFSDGDSTSVFKHGANALAFPTAAAALGVEEGAGVSWLARRINKNEDQAGNNNYASGLNLNTFGDGPGFSIPSAITPSNNAELDTVASNPTANGFSADEVTLICVGDGGLVTTTSLQRFMPIPFVGTDVDVSLINLREIERTRYARAARLDVNGTQDPTPVGVKSGEWMSVGLLMLPLYDVSTVDLSWKVSTVTSMPDTGDRIESNSKNFTYDTAADQAKPGRPFRRFGHPYPSDFQVASRAAATPTFDDLVYERTVPFQKGVADSDGTLRTLDGTVADVNVQLRITGDIHLITFDVARRSSDGAFTGGIITCPIGIGGQGITKHFGRYHDDEDVDLATHDGGDSGSTANYRNGMRPFLFHADQLVSGAYDIIYTLIDATNSSPYMGAGASASARATFTDSLEGTFAFFDAVADDHGASSPLCVYVGGHMNNNLTDRFDPDTLAAIKTSIVLNGRVGVFPSVLFVPSAVADDSSLDPAGDVDVTHAMPNLHAISYDLLFTAATVWADDAERSIDGVSPGTSLAAVTGAAHSAPANTTLSVTAPAVLGSVPASITTESDGSWSLSITVSAASEAGTHEVTLAATVDDETYAGTVTVTTSGAIGPPSPLASGGSTLRGFTFGSSLRGFG